MPRAPACSRSSFRCTVASAALLAASIGVARAGTPTSCESLKNFAFPDTTINSAQPQSGGAYVAPDAWHLVFNDLPPYCEVQATIAPTPDSSIKVRVWLPTARYNGRYLGTGNGGYAGGIFFSSLADGINRGFATANTDMGATGGAGVNGDALIGHPEKWKDFGWRATHLMTTFSKALIATFYGDAPRRSYFSGCSTGGQQGLMEAQRFPYDYDGILAGAPAFNRTHIHTVPVAQYRATHATPMSYIPATKFDVINQAVLAQCRAKDGGAPTDAFLTDPRLCKFDPATLACPAGLDGLNCLNADQVAAMKVYYTGSVNPANGALINPGNARGSETSNPAALGLALNENLNEPSFSSLFKWVFGPTWQWQTFDFNRNVDSVDQVLAADLNATGTDLRPFFNNGGKLILHAGWADPLIPSQSAINYFNALVERNGGTHRPTALRKTQQSARLFMAPGMWHCAGGPGPNSYGGAIQQPPPSYDAQYDLLTSLAQWAEGGAAPNAVIATKYNNDTPQLGIASQRPICSFPNIPVYNGSGDPAAAASFRCAPADSRAIDPRPAPQYGP